MTGVPLLATGSETINLVFVKMNRYTATSIFLVVSFMIMTSLFAALVVAVGGNDRNIGFVVLLLIYLFGALAIAGALYLENLDKSRGKILREPKMMVIKGFVRLSASLQEVSYIINRRINSTGIRVTLPTAEFT